jgi:hypothetical protein
MVTDIRDALASTSCGIKLQGGAFHTVYYDPEVCELNSQSSSRKLKVIESKRAADGSKLPLIVTVSEETCTVAGYVDAADSTGDSSQTLGSNVAHTWLVCSYFYGNVAVTPLPVAHD